nr:glycoside hydrolase family 15 protein [Thermoanaerobacterales bacterium]
MMSYPSIADHGLIGDLQSAALVATDGTIDWFCCPRFDSPSVFASLLDDRRGGSFALAPVTSPRTTKQMYMPDTAILVTRFLSEAGIAEVVDFMPIEDPHTVSERRRIVRAVRGVRGEVELEARIAPRFDYGRRSHRVHVDGTTATFESDAGERLHLTSVTPLDRDGTDVRSRFTVRAGETVGMVLESGAPGTPQQIGGGRILQLYLDTEAYWHRWLEQSTYRGRWREAVERSAITLKLMTYAPSGGLVAAPTAGLPEQIGGPRNWDYRFTWVRDASFSVFALLGLGFTEEAAAFGNWLRARLDERAGDGSGPLRIMYRVDGSSDLDEETLDHLDGYMGSRPVRVGNGAADQLQLDIYGEALNSIHALDSGALGDWGVGHDGWTHIVDVVDWLCEHWHDPDEGIWETRGGRRPFVYGQLMSWVAFDRAIRMARDRGRPADVDRWIRERDRIQAQVMSAGWNEELGAFVQYEGGDVLDASLVLMPLMGFIVPNDPRWQSTMAAMERTLVEDSLVYRYDPQASPDGLPGSEGTFSLCTFLYVDALARSGRLDEARLTFSKMLTYGNHLGLYAEEIDPTGRQVGNFPQAFTHLALIAAVLNLDRALDDPRVAAAERAVASPHG